MSIMFPIEGSNVILWNFRLNHLKNLEITGNKIINPKTAIIDSINKMKLMNPETFSCIRSGLHHIRL